MILRPHALILGINTSSQSVTTRGPCTRNPHPCLCAAAILLHSTSRRGSSPEASLPCLLDVLRRLPEVNAARPRLHRRCPPRLRSKPPPRGVPEIEAARHANYPSEAGRGWTPPRPSSRPWSSRRPARRRWPWPDLATEGAGWPCWSGTHTSTIHW
jgi:hypothetical protein